MKLFRRNQGTPPTMTLEGVLGPNNRLDRAEGRPAPGARAMAVASDGALLINDKERLLRISRWQDEAEVVAIADTPILTIAIAPSGAIALVCEGGRLKVLTKGFTATDWPDVTGLSAPVDAAFVTDDEVLVVESGTGAGEDMLARATWEDAAKGSVVVLTRQGERRVVASGLHAPAGICIDTQGRLLVTEMERATIRDAASGAVLQSGLPGYLARLRPMPGGYLLSCIARRDPLIEFLKTETAFVNEMKETIKPIHWIAPRIDPNFSHDVPIEMGATRLFGEVKAWAPSFSYGLVIALDANLRPIGSVQSRANGSRHAITEALHWDGSTIALSLATGELLRTEPLA